MFLGNPSFNLVSQRFLHVQGNHFPNLRHVFRKCLRHFLHFKCNIKKCNCNFAFKMRTDYRRESHKTISIFLHLLYYVKRRYVYKDFYNSYIKTKNFQWHISDLCCVVWKFKFLFGTNIVNMSERYFKLLYVP